MWSPAIHPNTGRTPRTASKLGAAPEKRAAHNKVKTAKPKRKRSEPRIPGWLPIADFVVRSRIAAAGRVFHIPHILRLLLCVWSALEIVQRWLLGWPLKSLNAG